LEQQVSSKIWQPAQGDRPPKWALAVSSDQIMTWCSY
jgi:hypothetical protein